MCEESQVKALMFLQNEVSSTVDHKNPTEANDFRSLLSHLLQPSKPSTPSRRPSDGEAESEPPKKRSRPTTPEDTWTSNIDIDMDGGSSDDDQVMECATHPTSPYTSSPPPHRAALRMDEDPEERGVRPDGTRLSGERFRQRTEVFEGLLEFVGEDQKQPRGNLLDLMDRIGETC